MKTARGERMGMQVYSEREQIRAFQENYVPGNPGYEEVQRLDLDTATQADLEKAVGREVWFISPVCRVCEGELMRAVGFESDGPLRSVCKDCLLQAVSLLDADERTGPFPPKTTPRCRHRIADARNAHIESGFFCVDCGALFAAAGAQTTDAKDAEIARLAEFVGAAEDLSGEMRGLLQTLASYEGNPVPLNKNSGMVRLMEKAWLAYVEASSKHHAAKD